MRRWRLGGREAGVQCNRERLDENNASAGRLRRLRLKRKSPLIPSLSLMYNNFNPEVEIQSTSNFYPEKKKSREKRHLFTFGIPPVFFFVCSPRAVFVDFNSIFIAKKHRRFI